MQASTLKWIKNKALLCSTGSCIQYPVTIMEKNGDTGDKEPTCRRRSCRQRGPIPGWARPPGEGKDYRSSTLAWRIPWTEEPGRLRSTALQKVRHGWSNWALTYGTGKCIQYPVINHNVKEHNVYICVQQRLAQLCKSTTFQLKNWNKSKKSQDKLANVLCIKRNCVDCRLTVI